MANCLKAQQASFKSRDFALAKNRDGWLSLFADDAVVMDPVGISPLDLTGEGQRGKQAIGEFYDNVVAYADMDFEIRCSIPAGDECANMIDLTNRIPGGGEIHTQMIVVYTANDDGKICSLKAYWEFEKVAKQLENLG